MPAESNEIAARISRSFTESGLEPEKATQLAFHMTDWLDDFVALENVFGNIGASSDDQLQSTLLQFLAHVPDHLAAAKKLIGLGPVHDVVAIGALDED